MNSSFLHSDTEKKQYLFISFMNILVSVQQKPVASLLLVLFHHDHGSETFPWLGVIIVPTVFTVTVLYTDIVLSC
jgi:hypothetical protein